jgi:hypothetical protein
VIHRQIYRLATQITACQLQRWVIELALKRACCNKQLLQPHTHKLT